MSGVVGKERCAEAEPSPGTGQSLLWDPGESAKGSRLLPVGFWSSVLLICVMGMRRDEQAKLGRVGMERHIMLPRFLAAEGTAGMCKQHDPRFGVCGGTAAQIAAVGWPLSFLCQDYYGRELQKSEDLKTNACVTLTRPVPKAVRDALQRVHEEVVAR